MRDVWDSYKGVSGLLERRFGIAERYVWNCSQGGFSVL